MRTRIVSIDFHRLIKAIDDNRLIIIDYIDYIDWLPMIDFHRLGTLGSTEERTISAESQTGFLQTVHSNSYLYASIIFSIRIPQKKDLQKMAIIH